MAENRIPEDAKFVEHSQKNDTGWGVVSLVLESESFEGLKTGGINSSTTRSNI